jgi:hypothetical protein
VEQWQKAIFPEISSATKDELLAYLVGASRDAYFSRKHRTTRFAQKDRRRLEVIGLALDRLGYRSWIYREGRRDLHVLESSWTSDVLVFRGKRDVTGYIRGYFDAEGGIPHDGSARFYIQLVQRDRRDLDEVRLFCTSLGIACGRMHNPSIKVDPHYWRFYVLSRSHRAFAHIVGSWHPRKRSLFENRFPRRQEAF